jgi:hypothetical protein
MRLGEYRNNVADHRHISAGTPIMGCVLAVVLILGLCLIGGGVWLVYLDSKGSTEISILGAELKTQSVGVVGLFSGLVCTVLGVRRTLKTLERLGAL